MLPSLAPALRLVALCAAVLVNLAGLAALDALAALDLADRNALAATADPEPADCSPRGRAC